MSYRSPGRRQRQILRKEREKKIREARKIEGKDRQQKPPPPPPTIEEE